MRILHEKRKSRNNMLFLKWICFQSALLNIFPSIHFDIKNLIKIENTFLVSSSDFICVQITKYCFGVGKKHVSIFTNKLFNVIISSPKKHPLETSHISLLIRFVKFTYLFTYFTQFSLNKFCHKFWAGKRSLKVTLEFYTDKISVEEFPFPG